MKIKVLIFTIKNLPTTFATSATKNATDWRFTMSEIVLPDIIDATYRNNLEKRERIRFFSSHFLVTWDANAFHCIGERAHFKDEHERRWNTPPELTPESVVETSDNGKHQPYLLSLNPVTATINLNEGNNNAHSVSLGASLDGISLSESNSYNRPTGYGCVWNDIELRFVILL